MCAVLTKEIVKYWHYGDEFLFVIIYYFIFSRSPVDKGLKTPLKCKIYLSLVFFVLSFILFYFLSIGK